LFFVRAEITDSLLAVQAKPKLEDFVVRPALLAADEALPR